MMVLALMGASAFAQETPATVKVGGFVRNYAFFDSKDMIEGTADIFDYIPKQVQSEDNDSYHFTAITSRAWIEAQGYKYGNMTVSARIEADFYAGLGSPDKVSGVAQLRLRQAFINMSWVNSRGEKIGALKVGQAWHPMAADMPDIFSLNTGSPFGAFSRTPVAIWSQPLSNSISYDLGAIWQMQYKSCGPDGATASYMKYNGIPELYLGVNYSSKTTLLRLGYDFLSLKPYRGGNRENSSLVFLYAQYKKDLFTAKFKTTYGQDGSHLNLTGGYAVTGGTTPKDFEYTPNTSSSTWFSLSYGKKWQGVLFGGYIKNFGIGRDIKGDYWFCSNSAKNINQVYRITPAVLRSFGKLQVGLEYEMTGAQYGTMDAQGVVSKDLKWVVNNRINAMLKFTF